MANFRPSGSSVKKVELWINPKPPWYKINIDGAVFFFQHHATGEGVVICDHGGRVEAALIKKLTLWGH